MSSHRWWKRKYLWVPLVLVILIVLLLVFTPVLRWYNEAQPQTQGAWVAALASLASAGIAGAVTMYTVRVTQAKASENLLVSLEAQAEFHRAEMEQKKLDRAYKEKQEAASELYGILQQVRNLRIIQLKDVPIPDDDEIFQSASTVSFVFSQETGRLAQRCARRAQLVLRYRNRTRRLQQQRRDLPITLRRSTELKPGQKEYYEEQLIRAEINLPKVAKEYGEARKQLRADMGKLVKKLREELDLG